MGSVTSATEKLLAEIEGRVARATPNPTVNARSEGLFIRAADRHEHIALFSGTNLVNDADLFEHSRTDISKLVSMVKCARYQLEKIKRQNGDNSAGINAHIGLTEIDRLAGGT